MLRILSLLLLISASVSAQNNESVFLAKNVQTWMSSEIDRLQESVQEFKFAQSQNNDPARIMTARADLTACIEVLEQNSLTIYNGFIRDLDHLDQLKAEDAKQKSDERGHKSDSPMDWRVTNYFKNRRSNEKYVELGLDRDGVESFFNKLAELKESKDLIKANNFSLTDDTLNSLSKIYELAQQNYSLLSTPKV